MKKELSSDQVDQLLEEGLNKDQVTAIMTYCLDHIPLGLSNKIDPANGIIGVESSNFTLIFENGFHSKELYTLKDYSYFKDHDYWEGYAGPTELSLTHILQKALDHN